MGYNTKIDWCDATWNPVTGCLHGCEYCYARKIAERFRGGYDFTAHGCAEPLTWVVDDPGWMNDGRKAAYPFGFNPTFHRYKLDKPARWKKPRTIFVCSMADLFGDWVPDGWIDTVIKATQSALQHRYLFLTKNPERYTDWLERFEEGHVLGLDEVANCWFGASASNNRELERARWEWVVIGAETGNSKGKIVPQKEWVQEIADICKRYGTPVFMKESLRDLMGDDFRQEFPWETTKNG